MDGLSDILKAVADANTPLKVLVILAIVIAAIVWQVSKRATLSEKTTQTLVLGGYGLVALLIVAAVGTLFLYQHGSDTTLAGSGSDSHPQSGGTPKPPATAAVTFVGRVYSGGDQRQGVAGATVHLVPLSPSGPQRDLKTDPDGAVTSGFTLDRALSGFMWASDDGFNPTNQLVFLLDPTNPSPPVQFFDLGAPKTVVAANTQPPAAAAPPPAAPAAAAPPPQGGGVAPPPASSLPASAPPPHAVVIAAEHVMAPHPGFHVSPAAAHLMANNLTAPMPHASVVAAAPATAPAAQALLMQTNYDAKFASIQNDEAQLCNVAAEAFNAGQYATAIKFILQAQKISKSGLWKLSYPKLAAAYLLTGQTRQGNAVLTQMRADSRSGILAGSAARLYIARDIRAMPQSLGDANRSAISAAAGNP